MIRASAIQPLRGWLSVHQPPSKIPRLHSLRSLSPGLRRIQPLRGWDTLCVSFMIQLLKHINPPPWGEGLRERAFGGEGLSRIPIQETTGSSFLLFPEIAGVSDSLPRIVVNVVVWLSPSREGMRLGISIRTLTCILHQRRTVHL